MTLIGRYVAPTRSLASVSAHLYPMEPRFTVVQTQFESLLERYEQTHENEILERQLILDEAFLLVANLDLLIAEHLEELKKAGKLESL